WGFENEALYTYEAAKNAAAHFARPRERTVVPRKASCRRRIHTRARLRRRRPSAVAGNAAQGSCACRRFRGTRALAVFGARCPSHGRLLARLPRRQSRGRFARFYDAADSVVNILREGRVGLSPSCETYIVMDVRRRIIRMGKWSRRKK